MNQVLQSFLDNLFSTFPMTEEMHRLKANLNVHMEEKYQSYIVDGKTVNEAIGLVISEFGSIDEILEEYGIVVDAENRLQELKKEEALEIIAQYGHFSKVIGLAVAWIISVVGFMILSFILFENLELLDVLAPVGLLICIAPSVGALVYSGIKLSPYTKKLETEFSTSQNTKEYVNREKQAFQGKFALVITMAVMLCVIGAGFIILSSTMNSVLGFTIIFGFLSVAVAVYLFITTGNRYSVYERLLKEPKAIKAYRKSEKTIELIAPIYWCIAVATYLAWSFIGGRWDISWIIFPIAGVLFGAVVAIIEAIANKDV